MNTVCFQNKFLNAAFTVLPHPVLDKNYIGTAFIHLSHFLSCLVSSQFTIRVEQMYSMMGVQIKLGPVMTFIVNEGLDI